MPTKKVDYRRLLARMEWVESQIDSVVAARKASVDDQLDHMVETLETLIEADAIGCVSGLAELLESVGLNIRTETGVPNAETNIHILSFPASTGAGHGAQRDSRDVFRSGDRDRDHDHDA